MDTDKIADKLDDLILATNTQTNVLTSRLSSVEQTVSSLDQTLRGVPGSPGLVADMAVVKTQLAQLAEKKPKDSSGGPTWRWIADNYTSIAIPLVLWFLLDILPDVLNSIKSAIP